MICAMYISVLEKLLSLKINEIINATPINASAMKATKSKNLFQEGVAIFILLLTSILIYKLFIP